MRRERKIKAEGKEQELLTSEGLCKFIMYLAAK